MATPIWVRFAPLDGDVQQIVRDKLAPLLQVYGSKLYKVSRLGFDPYEDKFGFAGDQDADSRMTCADEKEAFVAAAGWQGFVLSYKLLEVTSYLHVYLWTVDGRPCLALEIDSSILYYRADDYSDGDWLERFLIALTPAVRATVCAYGMGYEVEYQPLDPEAVVQLVRTGEVLSRPYPSFHAISDTLISDQELRDVLRAFNRPSRTKYFATTTGYHVFSNLR